MNRQTLDIAHIRALNKVIEIRMKHAEKFKKEEEKAQPPAQGMTNASR